MSDFQCRSYRSAIALNNIGVILLEHRSFQAASSTLNDAIALIKSTLSVGEDTESDRKSSFSISEALHLARMRLSDAQKRGRKQCSRPTVEVQVVTNNNVCGKSIQKFSNDSPPSKVFAILIEDFDCRYDRVNDALASILLLNLGAAYYCLSRLERKCIGNKSLRIQDHSKRALRLFRISHSLFLKQMSKQKQLGEVPELLHINALSMLSPLIIQTLCELRRPDKEARPYFLMLRHLRSWTLNEANCGLANGAAAAA